MGQPEALEAPLGTNVKSASPSTLAETENLERNRELRREKYRLQNYIQSRILADSDFDSDDPDWDLLNSLPKVVKCTRIRVMPTVEIRKTPDRPSFYANLHSCKSVWDCPVCSARIMEERRREIAGAMDWAYSEGYKVMMITFTSPHYAHQSCEFLLDNFSKALRYFRSGKAWQNIKTNFGFEGLIRGLETRYGQNGWHNHTHELWIVSPATDPDMVKQIALERWEKACKNLNMIPRGKLKAFRQRAVDVQDWATCSDYLAKQDASTESWGADSEVTKGYLKESTARGSLHPFQLVARAQEGCGKSWRLYTEYTEAFKGKASIFFTAGLKKRAGLDDLSDREVLQQQDAQSEKVLDLDVNAWREILARKARAQILDLADLGGLAAVDNWLRRYGLNVSATGNPYALFPEIRVTALVNDPPDST